MRWDLQLSHYQSDGVATRTGNMMTQLNVYKISNNSDASLYLLDINIDVKICSKKHKLWQIQPLGFGQVINESKNHSRQSQSKCKQLWINTIANNRDSAAVFVFVN